MSKKHNKSKNTEEIKNCTLFIDGMHCPSCEILIEKKLLQKTGIESVDASLKNSRVTISYTGNNKPDPKVVSKQFKDLGYNFSNSKFKKDHSPAISLKNGQLQINTEKTDKYIKNIFIVIGLLTAFFIFDKLQLGQYVSVDSNSSYPAFLLLGIVAGLSSCAALVGGLLLSMIKQWNELYIGESDQQKSQPHILFHMGRLLTFAALGGVLGMIGDVISLDNVVIYSIFVLLISVVMFVLAMQMLGAEWAQKFRFTAPKKLGKFVANESNFTGKYMPALIGGLTFFLPCGFTLVAQGIALASGNFATGALIMLMFALGTFPTLLVISFSGIKFNNKPHLTAKFNYIAGLIIIFFAIYNINGQLNVLGVPSLSDIKFSAPQEQQQAETTIDYDQNGIQVLNFVAKGFDYIPTGSTTLKAGQPAKLLVDNQGIQGCGAYISARGLFDGYVALTQGQNTIDLGTVRAGTYKVTCSMGMVKPVIVKVI